MSYERIDEKTPAGGDYSEIYYLDNNGNPAEPQKATTCIIRECLKDGTLLNEIYGKCNN